MTDAAVTIVGGGVHGTHLAIRLLAAGVCERDQLRIIEPTGLLETLRRQCQQCGMEAFRSPLVHHIGRDPFSLREFAKKRGRTDELIPTENGGDRPTVSLFFDHAEWVTGKHALRALLEPTRATAIVEDGDQLQVETQAGVHTTQWCLLAVGHRQLNRPEWVEGLPSTAAVNHVWDREFEPDAVDQSASVGIVGGGITAAKLAAELTQPGRKVRLFARSPFQINLREASIDWMHFSRVVDRLHELPPASQERAEAVAAARYNGSIPSHVFDRLRAAVETDQLTLHQTEVVEATDAGGTVVITCGDGTAHCLDQIVCATGFDSPYEGSLFRQLRNAGWQTGYRNAPVLDDETLRWRRDDGSLSNIVVSGAAAQQVLGPFARNIIGARQAGDWVVDLLETRSMEPTKQQQS